MKLSSILAKWRYHGRSASIRMCLAVGVISALSTPPSLAQEVEHPSPEVSQWSAGEAKALEAAEEVLRAMERDHVRWKPAAGAEQTWLQMEYVTATVGPDGVVGSSAYGRQAVIETVIGRSPTEMLLEYDLPRNADGKVKTGFWYFPVKVRKRPGMSMDLSDIEAVKARINAWIEERGLPRDLCGSWTHGGGFPFKFDCDPQSAIRQVESYDLRIPGIEEGGAFVHPLGESPGKLWRAVDDPSVLETIITLDPEKARIQEVQRQMILADMLEERLNYEEAVANAAKVKFEGTITVRLDLDKTGAVIRKTEETRIAVTQPGEQPETTHHKTVVARYSEEPDHTLASDLREAYLTNLR